jgi:hypothetical protein
MYTIILPALQAAGHYAMRARALSTPQPAKVPLPMRHTRNHAHAREPPTSRHLRGKDRPFIDRAHGAELVQQWKQVLWYPRCQVSWCGCLALASAVSCSCPPALMPLPLLVSSCLWRFSHTARTPTPGAPPRRQIPSHITLAQTALVATVKRMHRTIFGFHFKVKPRTKKGRHTMDAAGTALVREGGGEGEGEISLNTTELFWSLHPNGRSKSV